MLICPVCPFVNLWTKLGLYPENMDVYHSQKKNSKISVGRISVREERVPFRNKSSSLQAPVCSLSVAH